MSDETSIAIAIASIDAAERHARPGLWRDLSRDWTRWSTAERMMAMTFAASPLYLLTVALKTLYLG